MSPAQLTAGGSTFHGVVVVSGPGGNFLSNEVSYRVLRELAQQPASATPIESFHVHTQQGSVLAPGTTPERAEAMRTRSTLIGTLRRVITSLARFITQRRRP